MKHQRGAKFLALLLTLAISSGNALVVAQQSAAPAAAPAAAASAEVAAEGFSKEQLEQLVAPIALYSDALLMQILMASTYPLEVVEADRFMKKNPGLEDAKLDEALKAEEWDPSIKSMCTLPDVLKRMSENLDWTQDLGDAFLGQKDQLLDTVQTMRGKAYDSGNLKTTEQQVITVEKEKIIVIASPSPEIVYVPTYSPTVVYVGWSYPSYYYPPMYPYYPPGAGLISFGVGMAVGAAIWGDCHWGWGHHSVNVNVNHYNSFNRNTSINVNSWSGSSSSWNHNAAHRSGVSYKSSSVASQYGAKGGTNRVTQGQAQARGYSGGNTGNRQGGGGQAATRDRPQGGGGQASASRGQAGGSKGSSSYKGSSSGRSQGASAYSGSSKPSTSRASSSRGSSSRGSSSYGGSRGGGSRSGGGGGGRRK